MESSTYAHSGLLDFAECGCGKGCFPSRPEWDGERSTRPVEASRLSSRIHSRIRDGSFANWLRKQKPPSYYRSHDSRCTRILGGRIPLSPGNVPQTIPDGLGKPSLPRRPAFGFLGRSRQIRSRRFPQFDAIAFWILEVREAAVGVNRRIRVHRNATRPQLGDHRIEVIHAEIDPP